MEAPFRALHDLNPPESFVRSSSESWMIFLLLYKECCERKVSAVFSTDSFLYDHEVGQTVSHG